MMIIIIIIIVLCSFALFCKFFSLNAREAGGKKWEMGGLDAETETETGRGRGGGGKVEPWQAAVASVLLITEVLKEKRGLSIGKIFSIFCCHRV